MSEEHYLKRELYSLIRQDPDAFEFLQRGSLDGLWYWDVDKPENEWMSVRFKELFGYTDSEVPNTSAWWQENIFPEDLPTALANFEAHCADPSHPYDQVVRYRHKDGSTVWVRCRGMAIRDEAGRPIRMIGAHTDVTALKQAEEELAGTVERLERANQTLQDFAYTVTHDLKQPLRGIENTLRFVIEDHGEKVGGVGRREIQTAQDMAQRMLDQIDSLLQYARVGYEKVPVQDVALHYLVEEIITTVRADPAFEDARIEIEENLPPVRGNPTALSKILQNVICNALKYTDKKGDERTVRIRASTDPGGGVVVRVRDNGIGIEPRFHERIFQVFQRLHGREAYGGGSGAGLAIARELLKRLDGRIWVESTSGGGSEFFIALPAAGSPVGSSVPAGT